jgi:hypothetical protein
VTPGDAPGFPISITVSGSYKLSGNLTVPNENTTAIDITNGVATATIDMNGFSINGPTVCDISIPTVCAPVASGSSIFDPGVGIRSGATQALSIRNGAIVGMGRYAIFVFGAPVVHVDAIQVRHTGLGGILIGSGSVVNSEISRTGGIAVSLNQGLVKGNYINRNADDGVASTGFPITVVDNTIGQNGGAGIDFASTGSYSGNTLYSNLGGSISGSGNQTGGNTCNGAPCP